MNMARQLSLASALLLMSATASASSKDPKCDCFVSNGSVPSYFSHHMFLDFRSLGQYQNTTELLLDPDSTTSAPTTSDYFLSDSFASFWQIQNWKTGPSDQDSSNNSSNSATILRANSPNNIYVERNIDHHPASATWLTLRTARQSTFQSTAEIATQSDTYQYISMRMLARAVGTPGGCLAMFTYREAQSSSSTTPASSRNSTGGGSSVSSAGLQEVDFEILTKYPLSHVQCTNQPALDDNGQLKPEATQNTTLPDGLGWDDWVVYRLDWTPSRSTWYAFDKQIASIEFQTPRDPARIHINAWSDGSAWTGAMDENQEAHLQIQWWELLYNSSSSYPSKSSCDAVCSVDTKGEAGQVVVLSNTTEASVASPPAHIGYAQLVPVLVSLLFFSVQQFR